MQPAVGPGGGRVAAGHDGEKGRRAAQSGGHEETAERPGIAPQRLIRHAQQHAGVGSDEKGHDGPDDVKEAGAGAGRSGRHRPRLRQSAQERHKRKEPVDEQRPAADGHRAPIVEDQAAATRRRRGQHVPETQRRPEVDRQQNRAEDQNREGPEKGGARREFVLRPAPEPERRAERVETAAQAGEEKVSENIPRPLRRMGEMLGHHPFPLAAPPLRPRPSSVMRRSRKATTAATAPTSAVASMPRYPPRLFRRGSTAFCWLGSPYVSGLSIRRKNALSPP